MENVIVDKYKKEVSDVLKKVSEGLAESVVDKNNFITEKLLLEINVLNDLIKRDISNNENFYNNLNRSNLNINSKVSDVEVAVNLSKNHLEDGVQNFREITLKIQEVKKELDQLNNNNNDISRELLNIVSLIESTNKKLPNQQDFVTIIDNQKKSKLFNIVLVGLMVLLIVINFII